MTNPEIAARYDQISNLAEKVIQKLDAVVIKLGFAEGDVTLNNSADASYDFEKDPSTGEFSLVGQWVDERGTVTGKLTFRPDGSFFVEHDVIKMHPSKPDTFVEAVNAWGREGRIKAEARLVPLPFS